MKRVGGMLRDVGPLADASLLLDLFFFVWLAYFTVTGQLVPHLDVDPPRLELLRSLPQM